MKGYLVLIFLVLFIFFTGCTSDNQKTPITSQQTITPTVTITTEPTQDSCVKILGEKVERTAKHFIYSYLTVQNNCEDYAIFKIKYLAYESDGTPYRGFVPVMTASGTLAKSETKIISTELPDNWFTETEEVARTHYNHGIVSNYDIKIDIIQIGPTPTRASVISKYAGEITADVTPAKKLVELDPCGGHATGWGNEC